MARVTPSHQTNRHLPQARLRAGQNRRRHYPGADGHHKVNADHLGKARLEQSQGGPGSLCRSVSVRGNG